MPPTSSAIVVQSHQRANSKLAGPPNATPPPALTLLDASDDGKIMVEGQQAAALMRAAWGIPALAIGAGAEVGSGQVYCLRSDLFFVHTPPGIEKEVTRELDARAGEGFGLITVTDVTQGRAELRLVGPASADLLNQLCGLDFRPSVFPHLTAKFTSVAKTRQLVIRHDQDDLLSYAIIGARSLGDYLARVFLAAGQMRKSGGLSGQNLP